MKNILNIFENLTRIHNTSIEWWIGGDMRIFM